MEGGLCQKCRCQAKRASYEDIVLDKSACQCFYEEHQLFRLCPSEPSYGDVEYAKCSCKAGQGGCCKHVAALLYTILDFVNLNLKQIPGNPTCTQLAQTWSVPSGSSKSLEKAVRFEELLFEKADVSKPNKRYLVKGKREGYCATPQFAQTVTVDEIKAMASAFNEANRAPLFTESSCLE